MCHSCVLYCSIIYQAEELLAVASILLPKNDGFRSWRVVFKPDALCYRSLSQVPVWMIRRVDATVSQIRPQPIDYLDSQFPPSPSAPFNRPQLLVLYVGCLEIFGDFQYDAQSWDQCELPFICSILIFHLPGWRTFSCRFNISAKIGEFRSWKVVF